MSDEKRLFLDKTLPKLIEVIGIVIVFVVLFNGIERVTEIIYSPCAGCECRCVDKDISVSNPKD